MRISWTWRLACTGSSFYCSTKRSRADSIIITLCNDDVIHSLAHSPAIRINLCRIPMSIYWLILHLLNSENQLKINHKQNTHTHTYTTLTILQCAFVCLWANAVSMAFHLCFHECIMKWPVSTHIIYIYMKKNFYLEINTEINTSRYTVYISYMK